jgi:hypothetical protein
MVIRIVIDLGEYVKVALKKHGDGKSGGWAGRGMGAAGFCGSCVCLSIFLLLCRVCVSQISGDWGCVQLA